MAKQRRDVWGIIVKDGKIAFTPPPQIIYKAVRQQEAL